jgi:hypothetical protein
MGLRASPTYNDMPRCRRPGARAARPACPGRGRHDLEHMGQHMGRGVGSCGVGAGLGLLPSRKGGGLPSAGLGISRSSASSSSATPAPLRAEQKHTGIRWPSRSACSSGACSSRGSTSPSFR